MNNAPLDFDWSHRKVAFSIFWGLVFFVGSLIINYQAGIYATLQAGHGVKDIILDNISVRDVDGIFIYGIITFFLFVAFLLIKRPKRAPFVLKSLSIFIIIRSFFIILTHIGPALNIVPISPNSVVNYFTFTGDLFFSGHTGLPFLLALIFWKDLWLRITFICASAMFAVVVLLGHIHYSIDVFSAFFITYGIFKISIYLFRKESYLLNTVARKSLSKAA